MFDHNVLKKAHVIFPAEKKAAIDAQTAIQPRWLHFGGGNLYRAFHAEIAQSLIDQNELSSGIVVCETFDEQIIDQVYTPYENDILEVIMHEDGQLTKKLLQSTAASYYCHPSCTDSYQKVRQLFSDPSVQLVTVTITEKGYGLKDSQGNFLPVVQADLAAGPHQVNHTMSILASFLWDRFQSGALPIAMVSTDNFSQNGLRFQTAMVTIAKEWQKLGHVSEAFVRYLENNAQVTFPWSMIDRITPNPSTAVAEELAAAGIQQLPVIRTDKGTTIAPFANTEATHYLVIEDDFPNGRPNLDKAGVILTSREIVDKTDSMKVTTCLNPLHTAMSLFGCLLGYTSIAAEMTDPDIVALIKGIGYREGLPVVEDPEIIQPKKFIDEVVGLRLPNPLIPDTPQRIAADTSQKIAIRFGETIKKYVEKEGSASELTFIPLAIAGWLRYLLAIDDEGHLFVPSPDPLLAELQEILHECQLGSAADVQEIIRPILANPQIFGLDLYQAGIAENVGHLFAKMLAGTGAVRKTLHETVEGIE